MVHEIHAVKTCLLSAIYRAGSLLRVQEKILLVDLNGFFLAGCRLRRQNNFPRIRTSELALKLCFRLGLVLSVRWPQGDLLSVSWSIPDLIGSQGSTGGWVSRVEFSALLSRFCLILWTFSQFLTTNRFLKAYLLWDVNPRCTAQGTDPSVGPLSPQSKTLTCSDGAVCTCLKHFCG